jgi:hypothetical protein
MKKGIDPISKILQEESGLNLSVVLTHPDGVKQNILLNNPIFFKELFNEDLKKEPLNNATSKKLNARFFGDITPRQRMTYRVLQMAHHVLGSDPILGVNVSFELI